MTSYAVINDSRQVSPEVEALLQAAVAQAVVTVRAGYVKLTAVALAASLVAAEASS